MRILYVGQLFPGSTALARAYALGRLGHEVRSLEGFPAETGLIRAARAIRRKTGIGREHPVNEAILNVVAQSEPDVLWIDKGLNVTPRTLLQAKHLAPRLKLVHYGTDRFSERGNRSADLVAALPVYDLVATTIRDDQQRLERLGARKVLQTWHGFDPDLFRPSPTEALDPSLRDRIVFVGSWEAERARTLSALVSSGLPVTIVSPWKQWSSVVALRGNVDWRRIGVYGAGYPALLASGAVSLGFLRKISRDQHTTRSFEIPASGGLLVAERTPEHQRLFVDGVEAVFFDSDKECVEVCRDLLASPQRRRAIADAGCRRCATSGYAWADRLGSILEEATR